MPLPMKKTAKRLGNPPATVALGAAATAGAVLGSAAHAEGIESKSGRAIVTPTPRRNVRRLNDWVDFIVRALRLELQGQRGEEPASNLVSHQPFYASVGPMLLGLIQGFGHRLG